MSKCRVLLSHMFCPSQSVTQSPSQSLSQNHVCYLDDNDDGRSASNSSRSFALIKLAISQKLGMRWSISCLRVESVILLELWHMFCPTVDNVALARIFLHNWHIVDFNSLYPLVKELFTFIQFWIDAKPLKIFSWMQEFRHFAKSKQMALIFWYTLVFSVWFRKF